MSTSKLFQPIRVGRVELQHRLVMPPLTRCRADENNVILPSSVEYYTQRSCEPGTLIIAEATHISQKHCGGRGLVGIWTQAQIDAWRKVTDSIHAKGCYTFCQLIAPGRAGHWPGEPLLSSSAVPMEEGAEIPREMTEQEIWDCVKDFAQAAKNAIAAGFDGIELHGANGYLIDQFLQDICNQRTDGWGSSVENRSRFLVEVTKAVCEAIGSDRVGIRLSPFNTWQGMLMKSTPDVVAQFSDAIKKLKGFKIAYLHLIESRVINNIDTEEGESLDFALDLWQNQSPIVLAGGYNATNLGVLDNNYKDKDILISIGRYFVSNPDLAYRIRHGLPLSPYDRSTFYTSDPKIGYIDYAYSEAFASLDPTARALVS